MAHEREAANRQFAELAARTKLAHDGSERGRQLNEQRDDAFQVRVAVLQLLENIIERVSLARKQVFERVVGGEAKVVDRRRLGREVRAHQ